MKILRISLSNIASLGGVHHVDFASEPLRSAGLYAISGPTGAGKSSLLDALCLALYDATPRLNQVGRLADLDNGEKQNDPRNLLRRGCAEAFAEVAFIGVDKQAWTARWHVRRGHRKADARLQKVEMTLFRGNTEPLAPGEIVAGGNKLQVKAAIEEKIGLTFTQFTRAVLLAQNDFATFLKADDNERAEILKALTGTDEYDAISKGVYARHSNERKLVETLNAKLSGVQLLSPEERQEAEQQEKEATANLSKVEATLRTLEASFQWFLQETAFSDQVTRAKLRIEETRSAQAQVEPRRKTLKMTNTVSHEARALRIAEQQAQQSLNRVLQQCDQATARHTECKAALDLATQTASLARKQLEEVKTSQLNSQPALKRAVELDLELASLALRSTQVRQAVDAATQAEKNAANDLAENQRQRETCINGMASLVEQQKQWQAYLPFVVDGSKWVERIRNAIEAKVAKDNDEVALQEQARVVAKAQQKLKLAREDEPALRKAWDEAAEAFSVAQAAVEKFDEDQLNTDRLRCDETDNVLCRLRDQLVAKRTDQALEEKLSTEIVADQHCQDHDAQVLSELESPRLPMAIQAVEVAKRQLSIMQAAVADAAKRLREELREDCPCPVCGSQEHPYRLEQPDLEVTAISAARASLNDLEAERDRIKGEVHRLQITISAREKQLHEKHQDYAGVVNRLEEMVIESLDHPEVQAMVSRPDETQVDAVVERLALVKNEKDSINRLLEERRAATKHLEHCQRALNAAREKHGKRTDELAVLIGEYDKCCLMKTNAETSLFKLEAQYSKSIADLADLWDGLPMAKADFETDSVRFQQSFGDGLHHCRQIDEKNKELFVSVANLDSAIKPLQQAAERERQALVACQQALQTLNADKTLKKQERMGLFDGKAVSVAESEMKSNLETAVKADEDAARKLNDQNQILATATADLNTAAQAHRDAVANLNAVSLAMSHWHEQFNLRMSCSLEIADIDVMLAREKDWIESEQVTIQKIDDAVNTATSELNVHELQLQEHLAKRPTTDSRELIEAAIAQNKPELEAAKNAVQEAKAKIISDDACHKTHGETAEQHRQQEQIAAPWAKLNELIGSADGALFRKIAQRRTLDVLLEYTNHQLNLLAGRYRLLRLPESLNLIVLDRDMGDERRSIHSLSGGESFLVSLALALGLASLTSNRLRIESLFIDEGFGSLDPETLNTAMGALMHLEAQGRKVGVISHVTEMTDAIPVQIKIVKGRGGASKIVVPGLATTI